MCQCIHKKCQFESFFEGYDDKTVYYVKNNEEFNKDVYCLFHATKELKEKFTYHENELLKKIIPEYIDFCKENKEFVDFSNSIFHIEFDVKNINLKEEKLDIYFTNTVFLKYFRMDNLKCNELIFQDTEFYDGGGVKNRDGKKKVDIEKLIFRPYQLESDFVIDIGKYANNDGLIESDRYGVIRNIRFENHKKGNGIIYFIGLNEYTEKANFRNMILDNISFQNCDLGKCYFLNAKVDKAEFRNCIFPKYSDEIDYNYFLDTKNWIIKSSKGLISLAIIFYLFSISSIYVLLFLFMTLIFLPQVIIHLLTLLVWGIGIVGLSKKKHVAVYDEILMYRNKNLQSEEEILMSLKSLTELYRGFKNNLSKDDFQRGGDFFYSQRTIQSIATQNKYERILYLTHFLINGFGERFLRPLVMLIVTILIFACISKPNYDFIATENTPKFLLQKNGNLNLDDFYKTQYFLDANNILKIRKYVNRKFHDLNTTSNWSSSHLRSVSDKCYVSLVSSLSQFISPMSVKSNSWFKTIRKTTIVLNVLETFLLLFFFGAFILALKNRIKR